MQAGNKTRQTAAQLLKIALGCCALGACSSAQPGTNPGRGVSDPGQSVVTEPNAELGAESARLTTELSQLSSLTAAEVATRYPTSFEASTSYDLSKVAGLELIQGSSLKLDDAALAKLAERGFVISDQHSFPTFAYGYATIYLEDLPVYISADSLLNAVHRSYESILESLEQELLSHELGGLLASMHDQLGRSAVPGSDNAALTDADLYLTVARSLLAGRLVEPVYPATSEQARRLVSLAEKAEGTADVALFGVTRKDEDFSQFAPRAHYTDSEELSRYFRAMMWLGRVDFRLLETQPDGTQIFRRRQLEAALLMHDLIDEQARVHYDRVDQTVSNFVGEADYMVLRELDRLLADLKLAGSADLSRYSDQELAQALIDGNYGQQRISSHIMINGTGQGTLPLSRSFALLGQRYVLDSHVFSNVVYDRINGGAEPRMMPSPLDAAFAALGNDQAAALLEPELRKYEATGYPSALAQMRLLSDEHPPEYWSHSLYTLWLGALRELSPRATSSARDAQTLFPVARSEDWGRRLLGTQLASWAELRHDTILYAKQSYAGGNSCDFPDGYVDPYPGFFAALAAYADRGGALLESLGDLPQSLGEPLHGYFAALGDVSRTLGSIAEHERSGAQLTPEMLAFINDAVTIENVCGGGFLSSGWYKKLFAGSANALELDPTIADVHTQPTERGVPVGRVLHVGTGTPRLMVVVAEGCSGPRAYAGLSSTYYEKITENFERLDDETWAQMYDAEPEVPWLRDLGSGAR